MAQDQASCKQPLLCIGAHIEALPSIDRRSSSGFHIVVANYQVLPYNGLGLYGSLPLLLYSAYLTWAAVMNYVAALIVDRVGRVRMLVIGLVSPLRRHLQK